MHITNSMIHKELRRAGFLYRLILPHFSERIFRIANRMMDPVKGKCRSALHYEEHSILRADNSRLRVCVYSPLEPKKDVPGLLWMHGGGYGMGTPEMDEGQIRRFIEASGCVVVSPDYRLSVEARYPAALDDCYAALVWLRDHGEEYGMRSDQIMVGGNSAGGGLTAAIALYARDRGEIAIAYQMPLYPMIDDRMETPSATDNTAPVWNSKSNEIAWKLYLGDLYGEEEVPAYAAPARAKDLAGLPPTCTFVGSIEPFRDETAAYVQQLKDNGIPVFFKEFAGCFHGFDVVCARSDVARQARDFITTNFSYAVTHYFANQPMD